MNTFRCLFEISTFQASAIGNLKFIDIAFFILTKLSNFLQFVRPVSVGAEFLLVAIFTCQQCNIYFPEWIWLSKVDTFAFQENKLVSLLRLHQAVWASFIGRDRWTVATLKIINIILIKLNGKSSITFCSNCLDEF